MKWLTLVACLMGSSALAAPRVAVVVSDDLSVYDAPLGAFLEALDEPVTIHRLHGKESEADDLVPVLQKDNPDVVYALGAKAAWVVRHRIESIPLVYAMVMDPHRYGIPGRQVTGISMQVDPVSYLSQFVGFFPDVRTVGVMRGPDMDDEEVEAMQEGAAQLGLQVLFLPVDSPRALRRDFKAFASTVDAVWLPPDRQILSADGYRYLVEESRRRRLPLMVETDNMVQAGGLFATVPDPERVGQQSAALVQKVLDGAAPAVLEVEDPESLLVSLNRRVLEQAALPFDPLMYDFVDRLVD